MSTAAQDDPMPSGAAQHVARRRVYYISGVDPRGAAFYHRMWQDEATRQASVDGRHYVVSDAVDDGPLFTQWTVRATVDGREIESQHVFLRWEDLMRAHWPSRLKVIARLPGLYWFYLRSGMLARTWTHGRGFFWVYFAMPFIYGLLSLLLIAGSAWAAATIAASIGAPGPVRLVAAIVAGSAIAWAAMANAHQTRLLWLARAHLFVDYWARNNPFAQRWRDFAQRIESDLQRDAQGGAPDEVLVVGHCGGTMAAISTMQSWLALQPPDKRSNVPLKLLTLGQAIPLLGLNPEAGWFLDQLRAVGASQLPWIDYTAPADGMCYALADPFIACGLRRPTRPDYRVRSARFDRMFAPKAYARMRRDIFRTHFQYLMATQLPVDNDYFKLTCGPSPLAVA